MSEFQFTGGHTPEPDKADNTPLEEPVEMPVEQPEDISSEDNVFDFSQLCADKISAQNSIDSDADSAPYEPASAPKKPAKRKKKKGNPVAVLIKILAILIAAILLAMGIILAMRDYLGIGKNEVVTLTVEQGMTTTQIAELLRDNNAISHPLFFKIYSKLKGYDGTYRAGVYQFNSDKGYDGIVAELQKGNNYATATVKIPESATVDDIIALLVENDVCTKQEFLSAMKDDYQYDFIKYIPIETVRYKFEGYLYPDTYEFFKSDVKNSAHLAIDKMLSNFNAKLPDNYLELVENLNKQYPDIETATGKITFNDVMSIASIVSLEANGFPDEASNVAAVFYNRLCWDEPKYLGSTPTYNYPDNRYNTNAPDDNDKTKDGYEGLPPGAQCNPTIDSIMGALQPTKNFKATYFVTDSDMKFYYNTSYKAHINTINDLKSKGKWA